jgi:hypothetical protein
MTNEQVLTLCLFGVPGSDLVSLDEFETENGDDVERSRTSPGSHRSRKSSSITIELQDIARCRTFEQNDFSRFEENVSLLQLLLLLLFVRVVVPSKMSNKSRSVIGWLKISFSLLEKFPPIGELVFHIFEFNMICWSTFKSSVILLQDSQNTIFLVFWSLWYFFFVLKG